MAQLCGRIIRHQYVSLQPLFKVSEAIDLLREAAKFVKNEKARWDSLEYRPDASLMERGTLLWSKVMENAWHSFTGCAYQEVVFLFTDASGNNGWGYVLVSFEGSIICEAAHNWNENQIGWHIFFKESWATAWSVETLAR